jgi:ferredoxin
MKAKVDVDSCIGCGLCAATCPEVFKLNEDDISEVIVDTVPPEAEAKCREAAENCPVQAITLEE